MTKIVARVWRCQTCQTPVTRKRKFCDIHTTDGPKPKPVSDRLWSKVNKTDTCWLWTGATARNGYGKIGIGSLSDGSRALITTSRLAWQLTYGPIPEGLMVCHKCDNPLCCRPDHLFLGTCADNLRDMSNKGRATLYNRKITDDQVVTIRKLLGIHSGYGAKSKIARIVGCNVSSVISVSRGSFAHIAAPESQ